VTYNASANVLQLVRAHYTGDETAFASAATTLARNSKTAQVRAEIVNFVRNGKNRYPGLQPLRPTNLPPAPQKAADGMLQRITPMGLDELVLDGELQGRLEEIAIELEYRAALAERKIRPRSRLLFHGPPGNGKSSVGGALANAVGMIPYVVSLPRLISKYVGETGENLGKLFDAIVDNTFVILDEIDALAAHRGAVEQSAGKEFNSKVNTLLTLMDRNKRGIIVATTNRPDIIDPAVRRRFDEEIEFPAPSAEQKWNLVLKLCEGYQIGAETISVDDCENFDAVAKRVECEARRIVMNEILAAEAASEDNDGDEEN
jgi:SpoVK/Ycf46/Vps4 family AAA+-type ATPase